MGVEGVNFAGAAVDDGIGAGAGALLAHVPVPSEEGGVAGVPTDASAPEVVLRKVGFEDDVEGVGMAAQPADDLGIVAEGDEVAGGASPDGGVEVGKAVETAGGMGPVAVAEFGGDGGEGVEESEAKEEGGEGDADGVAEALPGGGEGECGEDGEDPPELEGEFEDGVHAADVACEGEAFEEEEGEEAAGKEGAEEEAVGSGGVAEPRVAAKRGEKEGEGEEEEAVDENEVDEAAAGAVPPEEPGGIAEEMAVEGGEEELAKEESGGDASGGGPGGGGSVGGGGAEEGKGGGKAEDGGLDGEIPGVGGAEDSEEEAAAEEGPPAGAAEELPGGEEGEDGEGEGDEVGVEIAVEEGEEGEFGDGDDFAVGDAEGAGGVPVAVAGMAVAFEEHPADLGEIAEEKGEEGGGEAGGEAGPGAASAAEERGEGGGEGEDGAGGEGGEGGLGEVVGDFGADAGEADEGGEEDVAEVVVVDEGFREPGLMGGKIVGEGVGVEKGEVHGFFAAGPGVPEFGLQPAQEEESGKDRPPDGLAEEEHAPVAAAEVEDAFLTEGEEEPVGEEEEEEGEGETEVEGDPFEGGGEPGEVGEEEDGEVAAEEEAAVGEGGEEGVGEGNAEKAEEKEDEDPGKQGVAVRGAVGMEAAGEDAGVLTAEALGGGEPAAVPAVGFGEADVGDVVEGDVAGEGVEGGGGVPCGAAAEEEDAGVIVDAEGFFGGEGVAAPASDAGGEADLVSGFEAKSAGEEEVVEAGGHGIAVREAGEGSVSAGAAEDEEIDGGEGADEGGGFFRGVGIEDRETDEGEGGVGGFVSGEAEREGVVPDFVTDGGAEGEFGVDPFAGLDAAVGLAVEVEESGCEERGGGGGGPGEGDAEFAAGDAAEGEGPAEEEDGIGREGVALGLQEELLMVAQEHDRPEEEKEERVAGVSAELPEEGEAAEHGEKADGRGHAPADQLAEEKEGWGLNPLQGVGDFEGAPDDGVFHAEAFGPVRIESVREEAGGGEGVGLGDAESEEGQQQTGGDAGPDAGGTGAEFEAGGDEKEPGEQEAEVETAGHGESGAESGRREPAGVAALQGLHAQEEGGGGEKRAGGIDGVEAGKLQAERGEGQPEGGKPGEGAAAELSGEAGEEEHGAGGPEGGEEAAGAEEIRPVLQVQGCAQCLQEPEGEGAIDEAALGAGVGIEGRSAGVEIAAQGIRPGEAVGDIDEKAFVGVQHLTLVPVPGPVAQGKGQPGQQQELKAAEEQGAEPVTHHAGRYSSSR